MSPLAVLSAIGTVQQLRATLNGWSRRVSHASIYGFAAFVLGLVGLVFIAATLFLLLADVMPPAAAAAAVAGLFVVLAIGAGLLARHAIRRGRGGTGTQTLPAPVVAHDPLQAVAGSLGGIDPRTLLALGAGLAGGLIAAQWRTRAVRTESRQAAE
ncbi:MAG TPA: phage holin family protein [Alphaproteobacteria bacterium]|nr:phage holin family protein [Alphaproteobacteria bacterium]